MEEETKNNVDKLMESGKVPTVKVNLEIRHIPQLVGTIICPHCNHSQWEYYDESDLNKIILTICENCEEEIFIDIPDFKF